MEQTTTGHPSSPSDTRQDWSSPIPSLVAFEILPTDTMMGSLYGEFAFTSKMTSAGYQDTVSTVPPSSTSQDTLGLPTELDILGPASSVTPIDGSQFPTDFHLSIPSALIVEDVSNIDFNSVSIATTNSPSRKFRSPVKLSVPESSSEILQPVAQTEEPPAFSSTLLHASALDTSAFDSSDAYVWTEQFSTSSKPLVSSTNSPLFREFEIESGEESNDVSTLAPISENEASVEDSTSTVEESENVTPGYLNAIDQPATSILENDSSQVSSNEHSTYVKFSTTSTEVSDIESSVVSDGLYPTAGIPSIMESSTAPESYSSSTSASSAEIQDLSQYSSNDQVPVSELLSFGAVISTEGSLSSEIFSPTFESNIPVHQVSPSTFFMPNVMGSSTQEQLQDFSSPSSLTSIEETDRDISLSTTTLPILLDGSTMDTKLVDNENNNLFSTINFSWETSQSEIKSPQPDESKIQQSIEGTFKPTEDEFPSPREEGLFSSAEAEFSTSSYVFSQKTVTTSPSSSSVTTDSPVTSSFQLNHTSTESHDASPSSRPFISSTNPPLFSEFEMGSGDESNGISSLVPIFENEGSGEDPTEEAENVTLGFLNATDQPAAIEQSLEETSPEYQDQVSSRSPEGSFNRQMAISALPSEFAETSPEGSLVEPTLPPNLVDSTFTILDITEASTERLPSSSSENSTEEFDESQDANLSIIASVSTDDSQLVSSGIYHTSPSLVDLPIKETASSIIPLVTDEIDSGDITPLIDTLKPTENEFSSPREEGLFSSVEADTSISSYISSEQTTTPSSSSVTTDSSVTSSFQSIDASMELRSASFESSVSSKVSPLSIEHEMGSGDEPINVSTVIPIFDNEGSGEDSTSPLEETTTDQPTTNISKMDSTINPYSSSLADEATISIESTSHREMTDTPFVHELGEISSSKIATIISESLNSLPESSTEIPLSSTPPTIDDIPSTKVPSGNVVLTTLLTDYRESELKPSASHPTFSPSSTSLSSQRFISEVVTVSSVAFSDSNTISSSTAAWTGASSDSSFGSSSAPTESTSSSSTSAITTTNSNNAPNNISTEQWINASAGTTDVPSTYSTESITMSSSNFTTSLSASSSTTSHSTSSLYSSMDPVSTTVKSPSTTSSSHTTEFSLPHSEIPTTITEPLSSLWNLLISQLNKTVGIPLSGEYSYVSNFFWTNTTSSNLNSEAIKEIPSPSISSPSENTSKEMLLPKTNARSK